MRVVPNQLGVECGGRLFEALEPRVLLSVADLPTLADLESSNNTVVRFVTNFGTVDIELFDSAAPQTVARFLTHVNGGDFDETFFHRLDDSVGGSGAGVLQGGGFRLLGDALPQLTRVPSDGTLGAFEGGRMNLERTLAWAQGNEGGDSTSEFFFNLGDNPLFDDGSAGEDFAVFGRVVDDASWGVVQTIGGLRDFDFPPPTGVADVFGNVPVRSTYAEFDPLRERDTVRLIDAEVIKLAEASVFFSQQVFSPEGFTSDTVNEFVPMYNPTGSQVHYEIIVHSERAQENPNDGMTDFWFRDRVIASGSLAAGARGGVTISTFADAASNLVESGVPYSIEIRSTGTLAATLSHFDFGTATGEAFESAADTNEVFTGVDIGLSKFAFVTAYNPTSEPVVLTVQVRLPVGVVENQSTSTMIFVDLQRSFEIDPMRRGGLDLRAAFGTKLRENRIIEVFSSAGLHTTLTTFDVVSDPQGASSGGHSLSDGSSVAVVPVAGVADPSSLRVTLFQDTNSTAEVRLRVAYVNPALADRVAQGDATPPPGETEIAFPELVMTQTFTHQSKIASVFLLGDVFDDLAADEAFVLEVSSSLGDIVASVEQTTRTVLGDGSVEVDALATGGAQQAATAHWFAEGFMDPGRAGGDVFAWLDLYNPNNVFLAGADTDANVDVVFHFADGSTVTESLVLGAGRGDRVAVHELSGLLSQISMTGRRFFSVEVTSDVPIVATQTHVDLTLDDPSFSGGFATQGMLSGTVVGLDAL